jgi:hypothetical protein
MRQWPTDCFRLANATECAPEAFPRQHWLAAKKHKRHKIKTFPRAGPGPVLDWNQIGERARHGCHFSRPRGKPRKWWNARMEDRQGAGRGAHPAMPGAGVLPIAIVAARLYLFAFSMFRHKNSMTTQSERVRSSNL